ncbi:MAG: phosphoglucosamine mutase [Betaproteobacteria bacterium]
MTTRRYFGTDGVRGKVGEAPITPDWVMRLGHAAGEVLALDRRRATDHAAVVIGKDTRISGYLLESALQAGLAAAGVDVLLAGPMPTPGVAYLTRALRLSAGIVISASHNPFDDNGIKFFSSQGTKLPDATEVAIESAMATPLACVDSTDLGKARRVADAAGRYVEFCKATFPSSLDLRGVTIVVDCAHGAAYHVAPPVFSELGATVIPIGVAPDGLNINDGCGATHPRHLAAEVVRSGADLGVALDGDGDRLVMADRDGRIYAGDELLYVIAMDAKRRGALGGGVVGTVMTNLGFEQALAHAGVPFDRAKVGDRYVLERMAERGWTLGGENSGHLICLDKHTTGDAIVAALAVLRALIEGRATLAEATAPVAMYPQALINVPIRRGWDWQGSDAVKRSRDRAVSALGDKGRVLLRPSGTEPVLRVMVEARDKSLADEHAGVIAETIARAAGAPL